MPSVYMRGVVSQMWVYGKVFIVVGEMSFFEYESSISSSEVDCLDLLYIAFCLVLLSIVALNVK